MNGELLVRAEEVGRGADRFCDHERPPRRPPEACLTPLRKVDEPEKLERRVGYSVRRSVSERDAVSVSEASAVTAVPVDELDHGRRIPERPDSLVEPLDVDRIDQPDTSRVGEGVRSTLHVGGVGCDPAEPE